MNSAWEVLVRCGDPAVAEVGALWNPETSDNGWFACPDNAAVDAQGRLWIATDQGDPWPTGRADGLYALETEGRCGGAPASSSSARRWARRCAGPASPRTRRRCSWRCSIPGPTATDRYKGFERASTFADPATRWPDFDPNMPPRPSVLAITKDRRRQDRLKALRPRRLLEKAANACELESCSTRR